MRKFFVIFILFVFVLFFPQKIHSKVLNGGISVTDMVPAGFFGAWKVVAVQVSTTNSEMFAPYSVEMWNLFKTGDVITLENPVSGASASITVKDATENTFTFQRITGDSSEKVTETATLTLNGDNFYGYDTMSVKYYKNGKLLKEEYVKYKLKAAKISGDKLWRIFGVNNY